jgi:hypothetical protein
MAAPPRGAGRQRRNGNDPEIHLLDQPRLGLAVADRSQVLICREKMSDHVDLPQKPNGSWAQRPLKRVLVNGPAMGVNLREVQAPPESVNTSATAV